MSDYTSEEEELEKLKNWWNDNKWFVISGMAAGASILFGYNWYKDMIKTRSENASALYSELMQSVSAGNQSDAEVKVAMLESDYAATPYDAQANLALAKMHVEAGNYDEAIASLTKAIAQGTDEISHVARLRLARVHLSKGDADAAQKALSVSSEGEFSALYQEARGDAFAASGETDAAIAEYRKALDHDIPIGDTQYIEMKLQNLGASID